MDVLFLNHNIRGQGTFVRVFNLAAQLAARGHRTLLVCVGTSRYRSRLSRERGVEIVETPSAWGGHYQSGGWGLLDILARLGRFAFRRYDLIYAFDHKPSVSLTAFYHHCLMRTLLITDWADWWCRGGHISMAHNFPLQYGAECFLEEGTKRISTGVTAICTALCERARGLGIPSERLLYLPSGADVDAIKPMDKKEMRKNHGISAGIPLVGHISANLIDADMLLESMARVFALNKKCMLLFLGPDRGWHRDMAIRLGIDDRIIWAGLQPYGRIAEFLACADIMTLPMRDNLVNRGRWPNRIGEHMAAGRATVVCAVGDMATLFNEERIGIASRPDADDFAAKVVALLENRRQAEELGISAREAAEKRYSWKIQCARFCSFVGSLPEMRGLSL